MEGRTYVQWIISIAANISLFSYGLLSGWMSPMTKVLQSTGSPTGSPLTDSEITWIASVMCLSAFVSVPIYSYLADKFGRKPTIIACILPQLISWMIKLTCTSTASLIIARTMCGISGCCFTIVPMYVKEISQDSIRGLLGSLLMLFQNIGIFCMYALGFYLSYYTVIWIAITVPIINLLLLVKAPESPAFLVKRGQIEEAAETLSFLRRLDKNNKIIQNEISKMKADELFYKSLPKISFISIFYDKAWRKTAIISGAMMTVANLNGNFAVLTFAAQILSSSGVTFSPDLQSLSFPLVLILGSFASMSCVEKFGRKTLLAASLFLVMTSLAVLASTMYLQQNGWQIHWSLPLLAIIGSIFGNGAGIMPIPYIIMSEMFNFQIRAKLLGAIISYAWFISFIQLLTFSSISKALGIHIMFFIFAGVNLFGGLVTLFFVPETRGKSVDQIEQELRGKHMSTENIVSK